eukprot:CAMPEP_0183729952 /NCGR_PEP_ID=MMETSP0737-20130205/31610_1 /TAXON_ID=385413 /ORGANISM="Thalassiosira miniscula, Strain CCMP1093" /LENGTH=215 /DNA_ID=CAMNT_0025962285 /DNA_START=40 /DNA_END=687 /DNA_ORIENTATION=-
MAASTFVKLNVLQSVFVITAFILMWMADLRCNFIQFTSTSGTSDPITLNFGIWYYQFWSVVKSVDGTFLLESCHRYPDYVTFDGSWKAARTFCALTFFFSLFALIAALFVACSASQSGKVTYTWEAPVYLLAALFQGLTLLLLSSNACKDNALVGELDAIISHVTFPDTCSLGPGGKLSISSMAFFFAASVTSFFAHKLEEAEWVPASMTAPLNV